MNILITGGAGFIGHHVVDYFNLSGHKVSVLDKLTYAGDLRRLREINFHGPIYTADFSQPIPPNLRAELLKTDVILHIGAETHVDRSIEDARPFVQANVVGTVNMLEFARTLPSLKRFVYFSTDEVFGSSHMHGWSHEESTLHPGNPYAATKAAGEMMVQAYQNTYDLPLTIVRCMNAFGVRQDPEKFIPKTISSILRGMPVIIHTDSKHEITRVYIHAMDIAVALGMILDHDKNDTYHICQGKRLTNLEMAHHIAEAMGENLKYAEVDGALVRPGIDISYDITGANLNRLGFTPTTDFKTALEGVVSWSANNQRWLK